MSPNFAIQNIFSNPPHSLFTSFCIGLASSLLAASLLAAPCCVTGARAAAPTDLLLEGDVYVNKGAITHTSVVKSQNVGMGTETLGENLRNEGTISFDGLIGSVYGMYHYQSPNDNLETSITNKGTITINSQDGPAYGIYTEMRSQYADPLTVNNNGLITITNNGNANYGILATTFSEYAENITINNSANIMVTNNNISSQVYGIRTEANSATNGGLISVISSENITVTNKNGIAYGIYVGEESKQWTLGAAHVVNSGEIRVKSTGTAYGISIRASIGKVLKSATSNEYSQYEAIIVTNTNLIQVSSMESNGTLSDSAYGMNVTCFGDILITNAGTIDVKGSTYTYGIYAVGQSRESKNVTVNNSGKIIVENNRQGVGILLKSDILRTGHSTNSGTIKVTGGHAAWGIESDIYSEIINEGSIEATTTSTQQASGAVGIFGTKSGATITNKGTIEAKGPDSVYGIYMLGGTQKILNTNTIQSRSENKAYGINLMGSGATDIHNTGDIITEAINIGAGIYSHTYNESQIINDGNILVNSTTDTTSKGTFSGIHSMFFNDGKSQISNNKNISVISSSQEAYGIYSQIQKSSPIEKLENTVDNSGVISVTNKNGPAYGIYAGLSNATMKINNTGEINVNSATAAHELFVRGNNEAIDQATIDTWPITLRDYKNETELNKFDPFAVMGGGNINFNGAKFIVTPGTAEEGFAFNKEFPIQDMICRYDANGNEITAQGLTGFITDAVATIELKTSLPFLKAELLHGNVASEYEFDGNIPAGITDDQIEQTIIIRANITPETSPGHEAEEQIVTSLTQNMNMLCSILDTQLDYDELPESWRAFAIPYYTHGVNYNFGYDTDIMGVALGATHRVNDDFSAGAHLNFATIDSKSNATENDALMAGLGMHAKYHFTDNFHIRGQVTGFVMENNASMSMTAMSEKITSDVDSTSLGMYAALFTAYDYKANEHHTFTPELALKYIYAETDGFGSSWYKTDGTSTDHDIRYGDACFNELYAEASLRWKGNFDLGVMENGKHRGILHPTLRAGARQALMGAEVESNLHYNGFDFGTTSSHANETSILFEGGLEWMKGDTTTSLTYIADFGHKEESHMGLLKIEFEF